MTEAYRPSQKKVAVEIFSEFLRNGSKFYDKILCIYFVFNGISMSNRVYSYKVTKFLI